MTLVRSNDIFHFNSFNLTSFLLLQQHTVHSTAVNSHLSTMHKEDGYSTKLIKSIALRVNENMTVNVIIMI